MTGAWEGRSRPQTQPQAAVRRGGDPVVSPPGASVTPGGCSDCRGQTAPGQGLSFLPWSPPPAALGPGGLG